MVNKTKVLIHIGYHKSASTYLQKHFFPKLPANFVFINSTKILNSLHSQKFTKKTVLKWINKKINKQKKEKLTITSHEQLSGHVNGYKTINPIQAAENLKKTFPHAKILIIIRNQLDYLLSVYTYRVACKGFETKNLNSYLQQEGKKGLFKKLEYHKLINYYQKSFGKKNVLVLPMEMLKNSPDKFHNKITDFVNLSKISLKPKFINTSTKIKAIINFWRPINFIFKKFLQLLITVNPRAKKSPYPYPKFRYFFYSLKAKVTSLFNMLFKNWPKISLTSYSQYRKLINKYKKSNQKLTKLTIHNLEKYHYPI